MRLSFLIALGLCLPTSMVDKGIVNREVLLSFWKVHVLHHASGDGVVGSWMLHELERHGYEVSAGTLYPLLKRLERFGWLTSSTEGIGARARRTYFITDVGREVLDIARKQLRELGVELKGRSTP